MIGGQYHIHLPLAARVVQRLSCSNVLSGVLVLDNLRTLNNDWLVICQETNFLKVLTIEQINFALQTIENLRGEMLQSVEIWNLLSGIGSQKLIDGTERHPHIESQLFKRHRFGVQ